jgi:hypothetical protein
VIRGLKIKGIFINKISKNYKCYIKEVVSLLKSNPGGVTPVRAFKAVGELQFLYNVPKVLICMMKMETD